MAVPTPLFGNETWVNKNKSVSGDENCVEECANFDKIKGKNTWNEINIYSVSGRTDEC
jgi:hypothetical protein